MKNLDQLEAEISAQREENIRLFSIFQYRLHEDEMQPLVKKWREGSKKIKELIVQRDQLLNKRTAHPAK